MTDFDQVPPEGAAWCCHACGRVWKTKRADAGDSSCVVWAVMVDEKSIEYGKDGRAVKAEAFKTCDEAGP